MVDLLRGNSRLRFELTLFITLHEKMDLNRFATEVNMMQICPLNLTKIITRSNYDANTDVYSVEITCKYDVNLKSTLYLLQIKSTNPVYIYSRFVLYGKIMFAFCKNLSKHVANLYVCITVFQRLYPNYIQNVRVRFTHVTCANIYFWTKFALLPNNQICECFCTFAFGILIVFVMRDERSKRHLFDVTCVNLVD